MNFPDYAKKYISKINSEIKLIWEESRKKIKNNFLKDFYAETIDYFLAGGKRIRPLLTIATFNAFTSEFDERIIRPSVGIEFIHNASLIHDDIIDKMNSEEGSRLFITDFSIIIINII